MDNKNRSVSEQIRGAERVEGSGKEDDGLGRTGADKNIAPGTPFCLSALARSAGYGAGFSADAEARGYKETT